MIAHPSGEPPRFASVGPIVAGALAEMRYPRQILVTECADEHRRIDNPGAFSGWWRDSPHDTRFMDRAANALLASSSWQIVAIMGPAQTGKSELGNNWQLHTVLYDPADMMFVMPDRVAIDEYVKTQWSKMLELIPELRARQLDGTSADAIHLKRFLGCNFFFRWPTGPTFRAKPIPRGRLDDLDDIPLDIGAAAGGKDGQGDALSLMLGRMASFSAYGGGKIYVNSTPRLGRKRGIEATVAAGTDERFTVDCLACHEPFVLDTETCLHFDRTGTPAEAAKSACVVCPHPGCGGVHLQKDKPALLATQRWVGRGEVAVSRKIDPAGKTGAPIETKILSQRWDGLHGFRRWSEMAEQYRQAELSYEHEQDEGPLKTYFQTVIGKNYTARGSGDAGVSEDDLIRRARGAKFRRGIFPKEARCLIMCVDQAAKRFVVRAWAVAPGNRAWLIDWYDIVNCGDEPLQPFRKGEHFSVLHPKVLAKTYPIEGHPDRRIKPLCTVLDIGGMDGATDHAFAWWHAMVKGDLGSGRPPVPPTAITLFKGGNRPAGKLLPPPTIDAKRQIKGAPQCELYIPNVNRIKDMADVGLRRDDGGAGAIIFPGDVDERGELEAAGCIAEIKAEIRNADGLWERPAGTANETLDTYVMMRTALLRLGGGDHSLDWVPMWARPPRVAPKPAAAMPDPEAADPPPPAPPVTEPATPPRPQSSGRVIQAGRKSRVRVVRAR